MVEQWRGQGGKLIEIMLGPWFMVELSKQARNLYRICFHLCSIDGMHLAALPNKHACDLIGTKPF